MLIIGDGEYTLCLPLIHTIAISMYKIVKWEAMLHKFMWLDYISRNRISDPCKYVYIMSFA